MELEIVMQGMRDFERAKGVKIGEGSERSCFLNAFDSNRCFKVSRQENSLQTRREIKFFEDLSKKNIKLSFLPIYYGAFKIKNFIGYEQESFVDHTRGGNYDSVVSLGEYIEDSKNDLEKILHDLNQIKFEMLSKNILCCDLSTSNIIVAISKNNARYVIIDGFGATEFIPICKYFKFFGRKKIERQWKKLEQRLIPWIYKMKRDNSEIKFL